MATQSNCRQIVLFDGDDHRTELFEDMKQLSKIPSHCEFYIFCSETDPIIDKILNHVNDIPQVRLRRSPNPVNQRILHLLQTGIDKYSLILIVCGSNPTYEHEFNKIWKKYGKKKLFVMFMNNQLDITVKGILDQLRQYKGKGNAQVPISPHNTQDFASYACPQCSKSFCSNNDLQEHGQNVHGSFLNENLYIDSSANVALNKKAKQDNKLIAQSGLCCAICNEDFHSKEALKKHVKDEHPDNTLDGFYN